MPLPGNLIPAVQPVVRRCTDRAIPTLDRNAILDTMPCNKLSRNVNGSHEETNPDSEHQNSPIF
jgi:hypothetical protein